MSTKPPTSPADREAEIIRLCAKMIGIRHERDALADADEHAPDDGPLHDRYQALVHKERRLVQQLYPLGRPSTPGGAALMAALALMGWDANRHGAFMAEGVTDWMALGALQCIAANADPVVAGETLRNYALLEAPT